MEMPGSPAALHVPHIAVEKLAVRESLTLSTDMPHSTLRRAPGSFVGIPVTLEQSSSRFLSFLDLDAIAVAVESDANSLIKFIPDIATFLEHSCLEKADNCKLIWSTLGPLLSDLQNVPARPPLAVLQVPKCTEIPVECVSIQGEKYVDEFLWLKKKEDQGVLDYIQSENAYTTRITEPTKPLQNLLYREFVSRLDQNRISVHLPAEDGWSYFYRDIPGLEYSAHCRVDSHGTEQVYLDENILAYCPEFKGDNYFHLGFIRLATSSQLVAYGIDRTGQESHTTFFLDLNTGLLLPDRIENMADDLEFSNGEECVYYTVLDSVGRAYKLNRHILGQNSDTDIVLYHEEDEMVYSH